MTRTRDNLYDPTTQQLKHTSVNPDGLSEQSGSPDSDVGILPSRQELLELLRDIQSAASHEAMMGERTARRWDATFLGLGIPTAVLAGVAGATFLSSDSNKFVAGTLSLIAAVLSSVGTFLRSEAQAAGARKRAAAWRSVAGDSRLVAAFEGNRARTAELRNQISILQARDAAIREGDTGQAAKLRELGAGKTLDPADYPVQAPDLWPSTAHPDLRAAEAYESALPVFDHFTIPTRLGDPFYASGRAGTTYRSSTAKVSPSSFEATQPINVKELKKRQGKKKSRDPRPLDGHGLPDGGPNQEAASRNST